VNFLNYNRMYFMTTGAANIPQNALICRITYFNPNSTT
jgi:hypothetical protein